MIAKTRTGLILYNFLRSDVPSTPRMHDRPSEEPASARRFDEIDRAPATCTLHKSALASDVRME